MNILHYPLWLKFQALRRSTLVKSQYTQWLLPSQNYSVHVKQVKLINRVKVREECQFTKIGLTSINSFKNKTSLFLFSWLTELFSADSSTCFSNPYWKLNWKVLLLTGVLIRNSVGNKSEVLVLYEEQITCNKSIASQFQTLLCRKMLPILLKNLRYVPYKK